MSGLDSRLAGLAIEAGEAIARWIWHKATGTNLTDNEVLEAVKRRAIEGMLDAAAAEVRLRATATRIHLQLDDLSLLTADVLAAFDPPSSPTVPRLDLDIEVVAELPTTSGLP